MAILYTFYLAFPDVSFLSNSTTVPSSITDVGIVLPSEHPLPRNPSLLLCWIHARFSLAPTSSEFWKLLFSSLGNFFST